jgi:hypothetical protein
VVPPFLVALPAIPAVPPALVIPPEPVAPPAASVLPIDLVPPVLTVPPATFIPPVPVASTAPPPPAASFALAASLMPDEPPRPAAPSGLDFPPPPASASEPLNVELPLEQPSAILVIEIKHRRARMCESCDGDECLRGVVEFGLACPLRFITTPSLQSRSALTVIAPFGSIWTRTVQGRQQTSQSCTSTHSPGSKSAGSISTLPGSPQNGHSTWKAIA